MGADQRQSSAGCSRRQAFCSALLEASRHFIVSDAPDPRDSPDHAQPGGVCVQRQLTHFPAKATKGQAIAPGSLSADGRSGGVSATRSFAELPGTTGGQWKRYAPWQSMQRRGWKPWAETGSSATIIRNCRWARAQLVTPSAGERVVPQLQALVATLRHRPLLEHSLSA
jgi:hypothetical protein